MKKTTQQISRKLTKITVLAAVIIGLFLSSIQVIIYYFAQTRDLEAAIEQIKAVIQPSVYEAAYKLDRQVAAQIANGLLEYDFIVEVELIDEFGNILTRKVADRSSAKSTGWFTRLLGDEYVKESIQLFSRERPATSYGEFSFTIQRDAALQPFYQHAVSIFLFGLFRNVVLSIIFLYIFSLVLTRHLEKIATELNRIDPVNVEGSRLSMIPGHEKDELGNIVSAANLFLLSIEEHFERREAAEEESNRRGEQLQSLVANSVDALGVSKTGIHVFVNPAYLKMFGYSHEDELIGKPIYNIIAREEREKIARYVKLRSGNEEVESLYVTRGLRKDGTEFDMEVNASVYGPAGDMSTMVILRDITEKKRIEEELRHAQKMEAIGTLAGGIAHDFNNILAAIIGFAEMARSDSQPGTTVYEDLDEVLAAGNRATELVQQILAFSRQSRAERQVLMPGSLIKETIKLIRPSFPSTIDISFDIVADAGPILAEPTEIHQILMNLYTNAFHSMERSGGKLKVSLHAFSTDESTTLPEAEGRQGKFVCLSVADTGEGIAPEVLSRIFDPYFTTKEIGKGTGMGLAIVHGIVHKYEGFITIDSELSKGTTIRVYLPVAGIPELADGQDTPLLPAGTEHILFIDDEEMLTHVGKNILASLGYEVTVLNSSLEAKKLFAARPDSFDLVITDQTMPELTGLELSKFMLEIRPDLPIILCTGFSSIVNEDEALAAGICEFVHKPIVKKEMAILVRRVLDLREN